VSSRRRRQRAAPPELNLTPLLDVIFNLIFFFVLGTTIKSRDFVVDMKLPTSATAQPAPTEETIPRIGVKADGSLQLDGDNVTSSELSAALREFTQDRGVQRAILIGDAGVTLQQLITVTDLCREAGVRQISPRVETATTPVTTP
jgi:biopolymer transport protein ExbD